MMKEIKEYLTKYIADDNKVFNSKYECELYENAKNQANSRKELEKYRMVLPNPIVSYSHCPNAEYLWYHVKNDDVYNLLERSFDKRNPNLKIKKSKYICVEIDQKGEIRDTYTLEESLNFVREYINKLEKYEEK